MSRRRLAFPVTFALVAAVLVACGSKTGLFGPDGNGLTPQPNPEGGLVDVVVPPDAPPDGPVPCTPGRFDLEPATAQLMFVIDRSGSMAYTLDGREPGFGENDRWTILRNGLSQTLTGFDQQISMGAKFFPSTVSIQLQCEVDPGVDIDPKPGNAAAIVKEFDDTAPIGGTPTAEALRAAADHLSKLRGVARTLVLATDGAPNCNFDHPTSPCVCTSADPEACGPPVDDVSLCLDDTATIATVQNIANVQKVPVYVIGIGSAESAVFRKVLDDMAVAGGRAKATSPRYYSATTANELSTALMSIRDSVGNCTFLTPSAPTDPDKITVEIGGNSIPRDTTRTDGWDWTDQSYGILALFGQACLDAQNAPTQLSGVVRCD